MSKLQIGVIGSMADLKYSEEVEKMAEKVGELIAEKGCVMVFGAEKDFDSIPTAACRGAKSKGGVTVGVTYDKKKNVFQKDADVIIPTGMVRGGGRELVLSLSCDSVIAIGGGSGTLTEIAIAYQADIPVVALAKSGGWSEKLADTFIDDRRRVKVYSAPSPEEAVDLAIKLGKEYREKESA